MTNIRGVIGEIDLDQTLSSRERTNSSLPTILDGATKPWGMKVWRVELRKMRRAPQDKAAGAAGAGDEPANDR